MKICVYLGLICSLASGLFAAVPPEYESLKADAERLFADGSFARVQELYSSVTLSNLPTAEQRWVQFRIADAQWRSQAATQTADTTRLDDARRRLEALVRDVSREEDRDRVWAEVQESLGDFHWTRRNQQNWNEAWPHYQFALDWWAGAHETELARQRYLALVWRMARPPGSQRDYYYGYWGNYVPLNILDNTLAIAQTDLDKAHAHYLIAMTLRSQGGNWEQQGRIAEEFEGALRLGRSTEWYDDALFNYADSLANLGRVIPMENGGWRSEPDLPKALELFRRLVREFNQGETRYYDQALQRIKSITDPQLGVSVPNIFLPDSEIQYHLTSRNVKRIDLALYPVDLNRDVKLSGQQAGWLESINTATLEKLKSWSRDTGDKDDYRPVNATVRLDEKLKPGAYLLEVRAADKAARELILVTDATLVLKTSGKQALVYLCNALDGSPLARGQVRLWEQWWDNNSWRSREQLKETGADGLAVFDLQNANNGSNRRVFASAVREDRQAFANADSYWPGANSQPWRIYAFTDRPAYRPKETVNWKFIARRYNGSVYSTPSDQVVEFEIFDPRGNKVMANKATLNSFGSAWGSLEVTEQMPLGEYRIQFWDSGRHHGIGDATLFRLEEYKLPEFKVSVTTPEDTDTGGPPRKKAFRLGEKVTATIQADYYFGGPVANASVEVIVYQNPFWQYWREPRPFPWFYEDVDESMYGWRNRGFGGGQIVKRETIKTDATGKASVTFDTPANSGQDFQYRIEARVTDSSRREIIGNGNVRVTRQRYYVYAEPEHCLYRPQDKVTVNFKAIDANDNPVQAEGTVKVTRDYWFEIWLAPDGREVKGDELKRLQDQTRIWPPPPERPDQKGWRIKFRGYQHDDILTRTVKTDTNGVAQLSFTPEREGYYRIAWRSEDSVRPGAPGLPITAETTVWVAQNATTELGYRHGGVEIIVDKDTFRAGQRAPVMLVAPTADRYILFSVEGEDLQSYQLVHLEGTVKLLDLPITEAHVPNIFLTAALVSDRQLFLDTKQVIVPPTRNFLTVEVKPDREQYQPRDEGTLTVTTKNDQGQPVPAEIALGLVDESVFYIQSDYAGDPRQFYFGTKRGQYVQTQSTFQLKQYAKLIEGENEQLLDEREQEARLRGRDEKDGLLYKNKEEAFGDRIDGYVESRSRSFGGARQAKLAAPATARPQVAMEMANSASMDLAAMTGQPPGEEPAVVVRSDFRSTVFWQPDVVTDRNGKATVKVKYPDSTTGWKATARAATAANQFGIAETTTRTKQPLIVRLQAPRFFVVGDIVTISAVVNNNTDQPLPVRATLDIAGGLAANGALTLNLTVPANGEARADWICNVKSAGEVKLKTTARGGKHSDAMEKTYFAWEHGIEKFLTRAGKARGNDITVKLDLPSARKAGSTTFTVQVTPSMAVTMLDALPYLIDYPYGCTEQTMSRFLPAVITAKTLGDLGLKPEDVMGRVFGGIETNFAAATHPKGRKNLDELDQMTKAGLERLVNFQHSDGGWGWWKEGESDHWMTAYVLWGLTLARDAGVKCDDTLLRRAAQFLDKELVEEEENPDMQAFMLHALAAFKASQKETRVTRFQDTAFGNLWKKRDQLNAYTRALLALAAHNYEKPAEAKILIANLENGVKRDERPDTSVLIKPDTSHSAPATVLGTAHWGEDGIYWRWSEGGVEATAFALRALLAIDPTNKLVEPVCNWLIKNRRGAQWNSTRDTAIVVLAMNDYLRASGELKAGSEFEVLVNGTSIAKKKIAGADVFSAPSRFVVDPKLVRDNNEIRIKQSGNGALYFAAEAKFFSLEEPIAAAGSEIFVKREYFKLVGRPTLLKGYVYDREPLTDGDSVISGERVETLLTIECKNNYEYLMFEDLKPAGLEAVEVRSGESVTARELKSGAVETKFSGGASSRNREYTVRSGDTLSGIARANASSVRALQKANNLTTDRIVAGQRIILPPPNVSPVDHDYTGRTRWVYQELRDRKVALFLDKLPEGVWEIRYDLRAEVPGQFHALPVTGQAMYVPEIRCNGEEIRVRVEDAKP
jgi:alpha-2-macroglobulin